MLKQITHNHGVYIQNTTELVQGG